MELCCSFPLPTIEALTSTISDKFKDLDIIEEQWLTFREHRNSHDNNVNQLFLLLKVVDERVLYTSRIYLRFVC